MVNWAEILPSDGFQPEHIGYEFLGEGRRCESSSSDWKPGLFRLRPRHEGRGTGTQWRPLQAASRPCTAKNRTSNHGSGVVYSDPA
jgi:hypothetical protein